MAKAEAAAEAEAEGEDKLAGASPACRACVEPYEQRMKAMVKVINH